MFSFQKCRHVATHKYLVLFSLSTLVVALRLPRRLCGAWSVEHATRYTAKHKLIAVCRATSVIYRHSRQSRHRAKSVAHTTRKRSEHTHTQTHRHRETQAHAHTHRETQSHSCAAECVECGNVVSVNFPFLEGKYWLKSCYTL